MFTRPASKTIELKEIALDMLLDGIYNNAEIAKIIGVPVKFVTAVKQANGDIGKPKEEGMIHFKHAKVHRCPICGKKITTAKCVSCFLKERR